MDNRREEKNGCTDYCIFSTNLDRRFRWPHYECYNLIESAQPQWDVRQSKSIEAWTKNSSSTSQATMGLVWHGTVTRMGILITCVSLSYHPAYSLNIQNLWLVPHNTPGKAILPMQMLNNSGGMSFVGDFPYFFSRVEFKNICFVFPRGGWGGKWDVCVWMYQLWPVCDLVLSAWPNHEQRWENWKVVWIVFKISLNCQNTQAHFWPLKDMTYITVNTYSELSSIHDGLKLFKPHLVP